ncbi:MFS transporter [Kitasatospora nipponensis]|uniref:MFS transporter n=1 Tax=Kitasatospora nipponensis TaxID=258049 RepID=UPI0031DB71EC
MTHPLRLRAFRLLFIGRSLSAVGDAVVPTALAIAVTRATGSPTALATVLACAMIPRLALLPLGGVIADRWDARRVALVTDLVRGACQLAVGLQLLGGHPALVHLATAAAVGGCASAFAMPTQAPLVAGTVEGPARLRANALLASASALARLAGPALAGLLIYGAGAGWAFLLDAASFALSAAMLGVLRVRRTPVVRRTLLADLTEGWAEVRSRDWYWTSLVAHCAWNCAMAVLATLGPLVAVRRLGGDGTWVAVLEAGAIGLTGGSLLAGRVTPRRPVLVGNLGLATLALPLVALAAGAPTPLLVAAYGLATGCLGFLNPVWESAVQQHVPAHVLARVVSYDWLVSLAGTPLGYALGPLAAATWGTSTPLAIAAALVGVSCLATAAVPGVRRLTSAPDGPAPAAPVGGAPAGVAGGVSACDERAAAARP